MMMRCDRKKLAPRVILGFALLFFAAGIADADDDAKLTITAADYWAGGVTLRQKAANLGYITFMQQHPNVVIRSRLPGINIPGPASRGADLMQIVGDTAPDIRYVYLSSIRRYIEEGFLAPLDDAIGYDRNGDGIIARDEVTWEQWWDYPEGMRAAATWRGHIYAIPDSLYHITGLVYRRDLFAEVGMNPNKPPASFDELWYAARKLTLRNEAGQITRAGLLLNAYPSALWHQGMWDSGGHMVMQVKTAADGREVLWPLEAERTVDPVTDEDLTTQEPQYRAVFNTDTGKQVLDFLNRLRWQRWVKAPSGEPVDLDAKQVEALAAGDRLRLTDPANGDSFGVASSDVFVGVMRLMQDSDQSPTSPLPRPFLGGEAAMLYWPLNMAVLQQDALPRSAVGFTRVPTPDGKPGVVQCGSQFKALSAAVMQHDRKYALAQQVLVMRQSQSVRAEATRLLVEAGAYQNLPPPRLREAGFDDLLSQIDPSIVNLYDDLLSRVRVEPYNPGWLRAMELFRSEVFDTLFYDEAYDYRAGLDRAAKELNTRVFVEPEQLVAPYRGWGYALLAVLVTVFLVCGWIVVRSHKGKITQGPTIRAPSLATRIAPWLLLAPAIFLIGLWSYYPLARGSIMAFEDYRLFKPNRWVGLDNFLLILIDPNFYHYCWNTLVFAVLVLAIGFFAPLVLALLLSEVPRGKYLFRTIFYLPSVTAGLVIMLLWKQMYEPTPEGLLNQLLSAVGLPAQGWLADPRWAMLCVIIPGVWAGAGAASLIYLAALKAIPDEMYEAADVDGAGMTRKIFAITLPMLKPLLVINFVGAFIGAFQGMGNILVMTGGGPADATRVLALDIWIKSFAQLEFGLAVAMAWMLGAGLIGFTVMQLRILNKVDFRRAEVD